jgi:hypothetical protein
VLDVEVYTVLDVEVYTVLDVEVYTVLDVETYILDYIFNFTESGICRNVIYGFSFHPVGNTQCNNYQHKTVGVV